MTVDDCRLDDYGLLMTFDDYRLNNYRLGDYRLDDNKSITINKMTMD